MVEDFDLLAIADEKIRQFVRRLLNWVETLSAEIKNLRAENQALRDENNRLKGEQGKPQIKANKPPRSETSEHSSEKERKKSRNRHKVSKKAEITVHQEKVVKVVANELPADAQFKGYVKVLVQDIVLKTNNVCFLKEKYYSASTHKTYLARLPAGYEGQFGPGVKALGLDLYFEVGASEPKILGFFENIGLKISKGKLSNLLI